MGTKFEEPIAVNTAELPPLEIGSYTNGRALDSNGSSAIGSAHSPYSSKEPEILSQPAGHLTEGLSPSGLTGAGFESKMNGGGKGESESMRLSNSGDRPKPATQGKASPGGSLTQVHPRSVVFWKSITR